MPVAKVWIQVFSSPKPWVKSRADCVLDGHRRVITEAKYGIILK